MKNSEHIRTIMEENHKLSGSEMNLYHYVSYELYNSPDSFDCFFELAYDEIDTDEQKSRNNDILAIFKSGMFE